MKNKAENKNKNKQNNKNKDVIDLTSYISPQGVKADVNGSYTGVTADTYFNDEPEVPVQDADDL